LKNLQLFVQNMQQKHRWELLSPGIELAGYPLTGDLEKLDRDISAFAATL